MVKADKDYLVGAEVIIETDCLLILGMVSRCATPDLAMLRWIVCMLSRARFDDEDGMISEDEEVGVDFFESAQITARGRSTPAVNEFNEDEYEGELLPPWTRYGPRRKQTKSERRCTGSSYGMGAPEKA